MRTILLSALFMFTVTGDAAVAGERQSLSGREYPDPYIVDGWRGYGGYRGPEYYAATSPYRTRREWLLYVVYHHNWSVPVEKESLSGLPGRGTFVLRSR